MSMNFEDAARAEILTRLGHEAQLVGGEKRVTAFVSGAEWARRYEAERKPLPIPDESEMEVVGGWLVVRNAQEPEYPAGLEYGPLPYSDAEPLVHLALVAGFPPEASDAEVRATARFLNDKGIWGCTDCGIPGGYAEECEGCVRLCDDLARAALNAARKAGMEGEG